jgi:hypothetical protein
VIGDGAALAYFGSIDANGGLYVTRNLKLDSLSVYTLRVQAYDSAYPGNPTVCTVTINVIRNPSSPIFLGNYETTINENFPLGDAILTVTARDADLVCQMRIFTHQFNILISFIQQNSVKANFRGPKEKLATISSYIK